MNQSSIISKTVQNYLTNKVSGFASYLHMDYLVAEFIWFRLTPKNKNRFVGNETIRSTLYEGEGWVDGRLFCW